MSWLHDIWAGFVSWLHSTPHSDFEVPSFTEITNSVLSIIGGTFVGPISNFLSQYAGRPSAWWQSRGFQNFIQGSNIVFKTIGIALTVIPLTLDVLNTWTSNNGNTIAQRFIKTGVILGTTALNFAAGYLGATMIMFVAVDPLIAIGGVAVIFAALYLTDHIQTTVYEHFGIK